MAEGLGSQAELHPWDNVIATVYQYLTLLRSQPGGTRPKWYWDPQNQLTHVKWRFPE